MIRIFLAVFAALITAGLAQAETIKFRDGGSITGRIISQDEDAIILKTDAGQTNIEKTKVESISYGGVQFCTVQLKDGTTLKGSIVSQDADVIMLKTDLGNIEVPKTKIDKVSFVEETGTAAKDSAALAREVKEKLAAEKQKAESSKTASSASSSVAVVAGSLDEVRASLENLALNQAFRNQVGKTAMIQASGKLPVDLRYSIYTRNQRGDAVLFLFLNLIPSLGSWIQGDVAGGFIIDLSLVGVGVCQQFAKMSGDGRLVVASGVFAALYLLSSIYSPFGYEGDWNNQLKQSLMLTSAQSGAPAYALKSEGWFVSVPVFSARF